jgi:hypothetical protein
VRAQHLQRLERATFHPELWRHLQPWARQDQPGDDLCLLEHGELQAIDGAQPATMARTP